MKIDSIFFEKKNRQYLNGVFCAKKKEKEILYGNPSVGVTNPWSRGKTCSWGAS